MEENKNKVAADTKTVQTPQTDPPNQGDPRDPLYDYLTEHKLYTRTRENFYKDTAIPEKRDKLYKYMATNKLWIRPKEEWYSTYFPEETKKKESKSKQVIKTLTGENYLHGVPKGTSPSRDTGSADSDKGVSLSPETKTTGSKAIQDKDQNESSGSPLQQVKEVAKGSKEVNTAGVDHLIAFKIMEAWTKMVPDREHNKAVGQSRETTKEFANTPFITDAVTKKLLYGVDKKAPRKGVRMNPDGSISTHLMGYAEEDGKYVAYPTLFQNKDGSWLELGHKEALAKAKKEGQTFVFNKEEEAAKFAKGDWKNPELEVGKAIAQDGQEYDIVYPKGKKKESIDSGNFVVAKDEQAAKFYAENVFKELDYKEKDYESFGGQVLNKLEAGTLHLTAGILKSPELFQRMSRSGREWYMRHYLGEAIKRGEISEENAQRVFSSVKTAIDGYDYDWSELSNSDFVKISDYRAEYLREETEFHGKALREVWNSDGPIAAGKAAALMFTESIPGIIGVAAGGHVGFGALMLGVAGQKMDQLDANDFDYGDAMGKSKEDAVQMVNSLLTGIAEAAGEWYGSRAIVSTIVKDVKTEILTKTVKSWLTHLLESSRRIGKAMTREALSEFATQLSENVVDLMSGQADLGPITPGTADTGARVFAYLTRGLEDSSIVGALGGAGMQVVGEVAIASARASNSDSWSFKDIKDKIRNKPPDSDPSGAPPDSGDGTPPPDGGTPPRRPPSPSAQAIEEDVHGDVISGGGEKVKQEVDNNVKDGELTEEEGTLIKDKVDEISDTYDSMPPEIAPTAKRKIFDLIKQREGIDEQIKEKTEKLDKTDESLKGDIQAEIDELNKSRSQVNIEITTTAKDGFGGWLAGGATTETTTKTVTEGEGTVELTPETPASEQPTPEETPVTSEEPQSKPKEPSTTVERLSVKDLKTNEDTFQNRDKLDQKVVDNIAKNYNPVEFDPIIYWTDHKGELGSKDQKYVISGHHRFAAVQQAGIENFDAKEYSGTLDEAIKYGKEEANANRTMETPLERARLLRTKRKKGDKDIPEFLKREANNARLVENLSYLEEDGPVESAIKRLAKSQDEQTKADLRKIADWIGEVRKNHKENLTSAHEKEMYDFLMVPKNFNKIGTKSSWTQKINQLTNTLDWNPEKSQLNLNRLTQPNSGEQLWKEEYDDLTAELELYQKKNREIINRFTDPSRKDYIHPDHRDYDAMRKAADEATARNDIAIKNTQRKILDIKKKKGDYVRDGGLADLFGNPVAQPETPKETTKEEAVKRIADHLSETNKEVGIKSYLPNKLKTETVKPSEAVLVKNVPLTDISIDEGVRKKVQTRIDSGFKSKQDTPIFLKYNADGTLELLDGAHRLLQAEAEGKKGIDATISNVEQEYETFEPTKGSQEIKEVKDKLDSKDWGSENKIVTKESYEDIKKKLKDRLTGFNANPMFDPELLSLTVQAGAYHFEAGVRKFKDFAIAMVKEFGESVRPYLKSAYNGIRDLPGMEEYAKEMTAYDQVMRDYDELVNQNILTDESITSESVEPGIQGDAPIDKIPVEQQDVESTGEQDRSAARSVPGKATPEGSGPKGNTSDGTSNPFDGLRGDQPVEEIKPKLTPFKPGDERRGGTLLDEAGVPPEPEARKGAEKYTNEPADNDKSFEKKKKKQNEANTVETKWADRESIAQALPILFDAQLDDVYKAEKRLIEDGKAGIMFTNGTGTGKTFTGLGAAKRFWNAGKRNIYVVVPSSQKVLDWQAEAKLFDLPTRALKNIKDGGDFDTDFVYVTTYANFYQNDEMTKHIPDLVLFDESHKLGANEQGSSTSVAEQMRKFTNHPSYSVRRARELYQAELDRAYSESNQKVKEVNQLIDEKAKEYEQMSKVIFLSATPFAHHKSVQYGEGYLWDFKESNGAYSIPDGLDAFLVENFGYNFKYGRAEVPGREVDQELLERTFADRMFDEGVMSNRQLDVPYDYSRDWILTTSEEANKVDVAYGDLMATKNERGMPEFPLLQAKFNFLTQNKILEAVKAKESIERIKEHLKLGRKVVVFHNYNVGFNGNPFKFEHKAWSPDMSNDQRREVDSFNNEVDAWKAMFPQHYNMRIDIDSPLNTFENNFPAETVRFFNGKPEYKKQKATSKKEFNDDNSNVNIIVVNKFAGKEGISLHDTSGKHPRVLIQLGLPNQPTDQIQTEGRIHRIGVKSDAIIEMLVTGNSFEAHYFTDKISKRSSTAENIATGNKSRNLKYNIVQGYLEAGPLEVNSNQGKGGKEYDARINAASDMDYAKTFYYSQLKRNAKNKSYEGVDYFATPEPIGLSLVEMADTHPGEQILEPSAGHGAIARWFSSTRETVALEPSWDLYNKLRLNTSSKGVDAKNETFENHHIVNKYDAVVMNPPFGKSGTTAIAHIDKAFNHLREGGRLIAVIPNGPAMNSKLDKWTEDTKNLLPIARIDLPQITFKRAGTGVMTSVVVFDKFIDRGNPANITFTQRDMTDYEDINELFDDFNSIRLPNRDVPVQRSQTTSNRISDRKKVTKEVFIAPAKTGEGVFLKGDTYNNRATIKQLGGKWNGAVKGWYFETQEAAQNAANQINETNKVEDPETEYNSKQGAEALNQLDQDQQKLDDFRGPNGEFDVYQAGFMSQELLDTLDRIARNLIRTGKRAFSAFLNFIKSKPLYPFFKIWSKALNYFDGGTEFDLTQDLNLWEAGREFIQDKDYLLDKYVRQLGKANPMSEGLYAYIKNELKNSKSAAAAEMMFEKIMGRSRHELGASKVNPKSLKGRLEADGLEWDKMSDYAYALHAPERNKRIKEMMEHRKDMEINKAIAEFANDPDKMIQAINEINQNFVPLLDGSGMTDAEARDIIRDIEQTGHADKYLEYAHEFHDLVVKGRIDVLEEGRVIDAQTAEDMRNGRREEYDDFNFYMPLLVKKSALEQYSHIPEFNVGSGIHRIIGTDKFTKENRYDPIMMSLLMYAGAVKMAEENKALIELGALVNSNPDPNWAIKKSQAKVTVNEIGEIQSVQDYTPQTVKDNSVSFKLDGSTRYIYIKPIDGKLHPLVKKLKTSHERHRIAQIIINSVGRFNGVLRALITSMSPSFALTNPFKDMQDALTNVGIYIDDLQGVRRTMVKNVKPAIEVLRYDPWNIEGETGLLQSKNKAARRLTESWRLAVKHGVKMSWRNYEGVDVELDKMAEDIKNIDKMNAKTRAKYLYERSVFLSDMLENVTRLSTFDALLQKGVDVEQAAHVAKNISINFEKKGVAGTIMNSLWLFSNAGVQGATLTIKALRSKKSRQFLALATAAAFANRMLLYYLSDDDDLDHYINNDFTTAQNMLIFNPADTKNPIKIMKPYSGLRVATSFGESAADVVMGKKSVGERSLYLLSQLITVIDPVGGSASGLTAFAPTVVKPLVDASVGINWSGNVIHYYAKDEALPDAYQYNNSTLEGLLGKQYVDFAQWSYKKLGIDVSPTTYEYLEKQYLPGVIQDLQRAGSLFTEDNRGTWDIPVLRRFYTKVEDNEKAVMYNLYDMAAKPKNLQMTDEEKHYWRRNIGRMRRYMSDRAFDALYDRLMVRSQDQKRNIRIWDIDEKQRRRQILR